MVFTTIRTGTSQGGVAYARASAAAHPGLNERPLSGSVQKRRNEDNRGAKRTLPLMPSIGSSEPPTKVGHFPHEAA